MSQRGHHGSITNAFAFILLGLISITFTGCGSASSSPTSKANEVIVAIQSDGKTLDPHKAVDAGSMRLIENMYSTLMRYTDTYGNVEPDLLASRDVADDFRTFTLTIRDDATFHASGKAVTAADVVYSLNRIREIGIRAEPLATLSSIEATDEHTVVMKFDKPMSPLLTYLAHPMYAIVDRDVVDANAGDLGGVDAGSGPFALVRWDRNRALVLKKHDKYHADGLPKLDRVTYRPIPDETARTTALVNGEVDIVLDVPVQDIDMLTSSTNVAVESTQGTFWEYLGLNTNQPPLNDPRVRQAIAWALDRSALNNAVKYGRATELTAGVIPSHHWAYADFTLYPNRDIDKAKALLADAGLADGFDVTLKVGADFPYQVQAAGIVKQMLKDANIRVDLQRLESTMFFADLGEGNFQMTLVGWVGFVDPDEWLYAIYHSDGKYNQQGYSNSEVDRLLEQGRAVGDREQRKAIYAEAQKLITADAPTVYLYLNDQTSAYRDHVQGYNVHATASTISLRSTAIKQ